MNLEDAKNFSKLNIVQQKAFEKLQRAYKKCIDSGIFFHQVLNHMYAYNGLYISDINRNFTEDSVNAQDLKAPSFTIVNSWADDEHHAHFIEEMVNQ
jgi:hypothetical protein